MVGLAEKLVLQKPNSFFMINTLALLIGCECTFCLFKYSQIIPILISSGSRCIMNKNKQYVYNEMFM